MADKAVHIMIRSAGTAGVGACLTQLTGSDMPVRISIWRFLLATPRVPVLRFL